MNDTAAGGDQVTGQVRRATQAIRFHASRLARNCLAASKSGAGSGLSRHRYRGASGKCVLVNVIFRGAPGRARQRLDRSTPITQRTTTSLVSANGSLRHHDGRPYRRWIIASGKLFEPGMLCLLGSCLAAIIHGRGRGMPMAIGGPMFHCWKHGCPAHRETCWSLTDNAAFQQGG